MRAPVGFFVAASILCFEQVVFANDDTNTDFTTSQSRLKPMHDRRRLITKEENLIEVISTLDLSRPGFLGFDIEADNDGADQADETIQLLRLDKMRSAVTSNTRLLFFGGSLNEEKVDITSISFLASPLYSSSRDLSVVSVNTNSRELNGIQRHGESGIIRRITPKNMHGPTLQLMPSSVSSEPRTFDCGTDYANDFRRLKLVDASSDHDDYSQSYHKGGDNHTGMSSLNNSSTQLNTVDENKSLDATVLMDTSNVNNGGFDIQHNEGEYLNSTNLFDTSTSQTVSNTETVHDYEGGYHNATKLVDTPALNTALSNETVLYGFEIDLIVDIDRDLIAQNGGLERAIEYVNFIVSTTNIILTKEFDLHLNVVQISETDIFDNLDGATTRDALKLMRQTYQGTVGKNRGAHLRHALLGKELGGGIAFTDTVCDASWGFAISSGLRGNVTNMDMYDVFMFAHEIGHNLGSGHPFDGEFSPPVDTCQKDHCPEGLPLSHSSTLMSYCGHFCGGISSTAFTYGGVWNEISPREDEKSWLQNDALIKSSISTDPQRISHLIWTKLEAKKSCIGVEYSLDSAPFSTAFLFNNQEETTLEPTISPSPTTSLRPSLAPSTSLSPTITSFPSAPPSITIEPSSFPTPFPSIAPTISIRPTTLPSLFPSITPTSYPSFPPTASPSDSPSSSPSRGVHSIRPLQQCESRCKRTSGYMFNVELEENAPNDIEIYKVNFRHKSPNIHRIIRLYTIKEGYQGLEEPDDKWVEIARGRAPRRNNYMSSIEVDPPLRIKAGEAVGLYLKTEENILMAGKFSKTTTVDENAVKLRYGKAIINGQFTSNYLWSGSVEYKILDDTRDS